MTKQKSQIHGRALQIVFPQPDPTQPVHEELVIQISVDCPDCGQLGINIPGHHLRALHRLLGDFLTQFPSTHLSGDLGDVVDEHTFTIPGPPPSDPRVN